MIGFIVFGLIVGAVARLIKPGRQSLGILMTLILGLVGSVIGGPNKQHGSDNRADRADDVEFPDVAGAEERSDGAADHRADETEDQRHENPEALPAGLDKARDRANDESCLLYTS